MRRTIPSWIRLTLASVMLSTIAVIPAVHTSWAATSRAAGKVTLTWEVQNDAFWIPISKTIIKAYTALHPNVSVTLELVPDAQYTQKLFLQAASKTLPDVLETADAYTVPFASHHIILNMQPYANADHSFNVSDIYPTFLNLGRLQGDPGLYMMPFSADAIVMFYNKNMFDAAGVAYPTATWTFQDFLNATRKLTKRDGSGKVTQWGLELLVTGWSTWVPWLNGFGGSILTPDGKHAGLSQPGSIKGLQALADMFLKYKVAPGSSVVFPSDPFLSGTAAIDFAVHANVAGFKQAIGTKFKWDVQGDPAFPNGTHVNAEGTAGFAVSNNSKQRAAAWDIVKFVGSVQGQTILAKLGVTMPIRKSMLSSPVWHVAGLNNQAFAHAIQTGETPPQLPLDAAINCGTVYQGLMQTTLQTMWNQILRGTPVVTAAKTADAAINGCISSQGY
jgi:multiple sugar transport system substrate-binding protein